MTPSDKSPPRPSRRFFLASAGGLAAAAGASLTGPAAAQQTASAAPATEPFWGAHQGGIITPQQTHLCFAAFDLVAKGRVDLMGMLKAWTAAASRMAAGQTAAELGNEAVAADGGTALGLSPARLTITFGFGPGLFMKDGKDRYGLAAQRPDALTDLPKFNGDQLDAARTGGDICIQACADDPQVAFHAVRELTRISYGAVELRWLQNGFMPNSAAGETPRNLMGFKDGTNNPHPTLAQQFKRVASPGSPPDFDSMLWVGDEGPAWLRGGSFMVARRIRISLEHWDRTEMSFQEEVVGRRKYSGAPLTGQNEFDPLDLDKADSDGNPILPDTAHARLATPASNGGAMIYRRGYAYNDGASFTAERWPPWHQGMLYDAGLFFVAYQRDPRSGFIKIFQNMAKLDAMNQFTTHVGSALFACPGGAAPGEFIGQRLFVTA